MENEIKRNFREDSQIHHGETIRTLRKLFDIKQETFANKLGPSWSQKAVSLMERCSEHSDETIKRAAEILGVDPGVIKYCSRESLVAGIRARASRLVGQVPADSVGDDVRLQFAMITEALNEHNRVIMMILEKEKGFANILDDFLEKQRSLLKTEN